MKTGTMSQIEHIFMFSLLAPPPDYTREIEVRQKGKLYCFAIGPLVDDGATRTFFISCSESLLPLHLPHLIYIQYSIFNIQYSIFIKDLSASCACTLGRQPHVPQSTDIIIVFKKQIKIVMPYY